MKKLMCHSCSNSSAVEPKRYNDGFKLGLTSRGLMSVTLSKSIRTLGHDSFAHLV
jgi:hypothetical protein